MYSHPSPHTPIKALATSLNAMRNVVMRFVALHEEKPNWQHVSHKFQSVLKPLEDKALKLYAPPFANWADEETITNHRLAATSAGLMLLGLMKTVGLEDEMPRLAARLAPHRQFLTQELDGLGQLSRAETGDGPNINQLLGDAFRMYNGQSIETM